MRLQSASSTLTAVQVLNVFQSGSEQDREPVAYKALHVVPGQGRQSVH
jgi:hypothetical protein